MPSVRPCSSTTPGTTSALPVPVNARPAQAISHAALVKLIIICIKLNAFLVVQTDTLPITRASVLVVQLIAPHAAYKDASPVFQHISYDNQIILARARALQLNTLTVVLPAKIAIHPVKPV